MEFNYDKVPQNRAFRVQSVKGRQSRVVERHRGFTASKDVKPGLWSVTKHGGRVAARQTTSNKGFVNVRVNVRVQLRGRVGVRTPGVGL